MATTKTRHIIALNVSEGCVQPPAKKVVMLLLALRCARDGTVSPDYRHLADQLGVNAEAVAQMVKELIRVSELSLVSWLNGVAVLRPAAAYMRPITAEATA
jgi:hypothetical protein